MRICILTSSRSDFGLLKNLIFKVKKKKINLKIIASGIHFSKDFNYSYKEILRSKIRISERIVNSYSGNDSYQVSRIFSKSLLETSKILKKLSPDLLIVLGDRYEVLASTIAAYILRIPVAHIHGGEVTQGAIDDSFRHAITKMSQIHFVANKVYKNRIIQLGEHPKNVFVVGALGIDNILKTKLNSKLYLSKKLNINFGDKNLLINFHPETTNKYLAKKQTQEILSALKFFKNIKLFFTYPGSDLENQEIIELIKKFVKQNDNAYFFKSLGSVNHLSFLNIVDAVIGNSSSGIIEMPYFKKPTINLGNRQSGRLLASSIINCEIKKTKIVQSIKFIYSKEIKLRKKKNFIPYKITGASDKIVDILLKKKNNITFKKFFYDIK